jgi:hypothetical protein
MKIQVDAAGFARDLKRACAQELARVEKAIDEEVKAGGDSLKADLRSETEALLGPKIANAWRGKFYANKGQGGGPASFVWSKAPRILDFFSSSKIITPLGQAFAIPTENVPRGNRGRRLSPIEVEARFNTELQPGRLKNGQIGLFMDLVAARSGRGFRQATTRRKAQGRASKPVLMFVLWKGPLRGRKLIDLEAAANRAAARTAANIATRIERGI